MNQTDREIFLLWKDTERSPYLNMAIDEELLAQSVELNSCILRFYGWDRKAMSIGYIQNFSKTFREGFVLVRRPTGGGVVFHDADLTYTVVIPKGHRIEKLSREESYSVIHKAIMKAFDFLGVNSELVSDNTETKDRSNTQCFITPVRFDVSSKGSKIAGAAQRRTKSGILHQGSIAIGKIGVSRAELMQSITKAFEFEKNVSFAEFKPSAQFILRAEKLADSKYSDDSWNKMR